MNEQWIEQFKRKIEHFAERSPSQDNEFPISIKLRPISGCCCGSCSPTVDSVVKDGARLFRTSRIYIEEHETGPEVIAWISLTVVSISLAKEIIAFVTAVLNAMVQSKKRGEKITAPVKVIVRTIRQDDAYREEEVLEFSCTDPVTEIEIKEVLTKATHNMMVNQSQPIAGNVESGKSISQSH